MSNNPNTIWLESARESLEEALQLRNFGLAQDILDDVRDAGFTKEYESGMMVLKAKMSGEKYDSTGEPPRE